jgi:hypothetical protein
MENTQSYTASSIRVLKEAEVLERFDWAKIGALAEQYGKSEEWIRKGFTACTEAGVHESYFVRRYLEGDKTVPAHEGVEEAFRRLFVRRAHG